MDSDDMMAGYGNLPTGYRRMIQQQMDCLEADFEYMAKRDMTLSTFFLATGMPVGSRGN